MSMPTAPEETKPSAEHTKEATDSVSNDGPKNIQAFYNWIASHGKEFTRSWFLEKMPHYTEEDLKQEYHVVNAYKEIKQKMNWQQIKNRIMLSALATKKWGAHRRGQKGFADIEYWGLPEKYFMSEAMA